LSVISTAAKPNEREKYKAERVEEKNNVTEEHNDCAEVMDCICFETCPN
jgi:hypothetical protein